MPTTIFRDDVRELLEEGAQLVYVLPSEEYGGSHLPGAIHPPQGAGRGDDRGLGRDAPVIVYRRDYL